MSKYFAQVTLEGTNTRKLEKVNKRSRKDIKRNKSLRLVKKTRKSSVESSYNHGRVSQEQSHNLRHIVSSQGYTSLRGNILKYQTSGTRSWESS